MRTILAALWLGSACLGATAVGAAPPAPAEASFRVGGVMFRMPMPPGYCLPRGLQVDVAQLLAAGDNENVTDLTLMPCAAPVDGAELGKQKDYIVIKTPRQALIAEVTREELIQGVGKAFENPAFTEALASGKLLNNAGKGMSEVLGTKVDLSGAVAPRGKDDLCAYLGGTLAIASADDSYTIAVGACTTAVGGRVLTIYWYGPDESPAGIARLLVRTKGLARTIARRAEP